MGECFVLVSFAQHFVQQQGGGLFRLSRHYCSKNKVRMTLSGNYERLICKIWSQSCQKKKKVNHLSNLICCSQVREAGVCFVKQRLMHSTAVYCWLLIMWSKWCLQSPLVTFSQQDLQSTVCIAGPTSLPPLAADSRLGVTTELVITATPGPVLTADK